MTSGMTNDRSCSVPFLVAVACALGACTQQPSGSTALARSAVISDQVHGNGTPGFFWLPPIAPALEQYGTFAPEASPVVSIEKLPLDSADPIAKFTSDPGSQRDRVKSDGFSQYMVEWHTEDSDLETGAAYRIRVLLQTLELGFVDVRVLAAGEKRNAIPHDQFFPIENGRTLPIKFRIDEAALRCVGVVCDAPDECHDLGGACDVHTGQCSYPAKPDGTLCDDHSACTTADTCTSGICSGPPLNCDDGNGCTQDGCNPQQGCVFVHQYGPTCDAAAPPDDVTIVDFMLSNGPFRSNQTVNLSITLGAVTDHPDYMLEFILFSADDMSPDRPGLVLHSTTVDVVPAGFSQRWLEVTIPSDATPGRYVLLAHEYPDGPFVSSQNSIIEIGSSIALPVLDALDYQPDSDALLIDPASTVADAGVHLNSPFAGTFQVIARNYGASAVPIRAYLDWNGGRVPLQLWDFAQDKYVDQLVVPLGADEPTSIPIEAVLSEADAAPIRDSIPPQTPIATHVDLILNENGEATEGPCEDPVSGPTVCEHDVTAPAILFMPPPDETVSAFDTTDTNPRVFQKSYRKSFEIKNFLGIGMEFNDRASLAQNGYEGRASAVFPARIFNTDFAFASVSATAVAPIATNASFTYDFSLTGTTIASETINDGTISLDFDLPSIVSELAYNYTLIVYGAPVTMTLGMRGSVETKLAVTARSALASGGEAQLGLLATPHAYIAVFVAAGIGVNWSAFHFGAYLEGRFNFIDAQLNAGAGGRLDLVVERPKLYLRGSLDAEAWYEVQAFSKTIALRVEWPVLAFCGPWFAPHPCGFAYDSNTKILFTFPGYRLSKETFLAAHHPYEIAMDCTTCASVDAQCGEVADICGGKVSCGECSPGAVCIENACASQCNPVVCGGPDTQCGAVVDNCGNTVWCGECSPDTICSENVCVPRCNPVVCGGPGTQCGAVVDNCGNTVDCGQCEDGDACINNVCRSPGDFDECSDGCDTCQACSHGRCVDVLCDPSP